MQLGPKRRGPVPPSGGRVRITINLPLALVPFVRCAFGRSQSEKIVNILNAVAQLKKLKKTRKK